MLMLFLPGGYNRPAVKVPSLPFDEATSTLALLYDERSYAKSTRRKNACAMHTTPGGGKKIMLLRRVQVAIPLAGQSKLFSMSVLRKMPLCLKSPVLCDPGILCPDSDRLRRTSSRAVFFVRQSSLCQGFGKALQALCPSGLHALDIRSSFGGTLNDARPHDLFRLATLLGEGDGGQYLKHGVAIRIQRGAGEDEPLGLEDLVVNARHGIDGAVGAAHVNADRPAGPHIQVTDWVRKPAGAPPLCHLLWIGPGLEHEFPRRVKDAREHQLTLFVCHDVSRGHAFSPFSVHHANSHPSGQSSPSRTAGSAPPSRRRP